LNKTYINFIILKEKPEIFPAFLFNIKLMNSCLTKLFIDGCTLLPYIGNGVNENSNCIAIFALCSAKKYVSLRAFSTI